MFDLRRPPLHLLLLLLLLLCAPGGCSSPPSGPYATPADGSRSPLRAERLTQAALQELDRGDPEDAERLFREALTADLYYGPAHNNLGVLYLKQGKLYEAANEFEWARKLLPGHPDPRLNLALTLERAGRIDDAMATYETALEVASEHIPSMQALARAHLRYDRRDERLQGWLAEIALRGDTREWREWASFHLAALP